MIRDATRGYVDSLRGGYEPLRRESVKVGACVSGGPPRLPGKQLGQLLARAGESHIQGLD